MPKHLLICVLFVSALLSACSKEKEDKKDSKIDSLQATSTPSIAISPRVISLDGSPILGAKVLIGSALNRPFDNNYVVTDINGHFPLPPGWDGSEQPLTLDAPGYARVTYFSQRAQGQTLKMRPQASKEIYELSGLTSGFNVINRDGIADFGLVMPALDRQNLFSFDTRLVISPINDTIKIYGQDVLIPTNVTLPKQKENYILPVTLDKPEYHLWFQSSGPQKVVALRGQFPLKEVVDALRAQTEFMELINKFTILSGSVTDLQLADPQTRADLNVGRIPFNQSRRVLAPTIAPEDLVVAVALQKQQNILLPTDVKNLDSGKTQSLRIASSNAQVLSVLKRKAETSNNNLRDRLSAHIQELSDGVMPEFLPLLDDPHLLSDQTLQIQRPATNTPTNLSELATYSTISVVKTNTSSGSQVEELVLLWETYSSGWQSSIELPEWPEGRLSNDHHRWGVSLLGGEMTSSLELGPAVLDNASHATHSSTDY